MNASPGPPEIFDSRRRAAKLARGEKAFAAADFLHVRAAENAVNSLEVILRDFPDAVDLSARPGPIAGQIRHIPPAVLDGTEQPGS